MSIEQLKPAEQAAYMAYMPYYQGAKKNMLPLAMGLYQKGVLEGHRKIEGGDNIPFVATWVISRLPAEITRCRMQFDGNAEQSYEVTLVNSEFVDFLIEVINNYKRTRSADFSQTFYRKLLRAEA